MFGGCALMCHTFPILSPLLVLVLSIVETCERFNAHARDQDPDNEVGFALRQLVGSLMCTVRVSVGAGSYYRCFRDFRRQSCTSPPQAQSTC